MQIMHASKIGPNKGGSGCQSSYRKLVEPQANDTFTFTRLLCESLMWVLKLNPACTCVVFKVGSAI